MTRRKYFGAFGIKADGTTHDTVAIQKALYEAAKTGATVVLPPARYCRTIRARSRSHITA
jgi:polygalacturonase